MCPPISFLAQRNWKFKLAFFIEMCPLSAVVVVVTFAVVNFSHFRRLLKNHWANFNQNGKKHLWVMGFQVCSNQVPRPFPKKDNNALAKIQDKIKKSSSPEPLGQFKQNCTLHHWVRGIHICSNEKPRRFPRGENNEIAKIHS